MTLKKEYKITVFTPTYNRADLLHRVYESLCVQTLTDFEWLVIDDGSSDNTDSVMESYSNDAKLSIRYIKNRENTGKVSLINQALFECESEFFLVFDSDDWCVPNALEVFLNAWLSLGYEAEQYCAVSALKTFKTGEVVGEVYGDFAGKGKTYVDRLNHGVKGDKWEFIKTDIHRKYVYDLQGGDRYMAPEYAWVLMGRTYKTIFIDERLSVVEYQQTGISKNNLKYRIGSARSAVVVYELFSKSAASMRVSFRSNLNKSRFEYHAGISQSSGVIIKTLGWLHYVKDKYAAS